MSSSTYNLTTPTAVEILAAVTILDDLDPALIDPEERDDAAVSVRVLLAAYSDLARRHGEQRVELERARADRDDYRDMWLAERATTAQHAHRADVARALCGESGRYVDTVDVERALDGSNR
jgi:hypothetical protein